MRIASKAKDFSATVALTLVDRRALHLDDTLRERLPQLPAACGSVTLRQFLQHTSALPDFWQRAEFLDALRADPRHHSDSRRLLDHVADEPLRFAPGTRYRYSDSDDIAVALMAEAAARTPYEDLLRKLVHTPLRLRDTSLPQSHPEALPVRVRREPPGPRCCGPVPRARTRPRPTAAAARRLARRRTVPPRSSG